MRAHQRLQLMNMFFIQLSGNAAKVQMTFSPQYILTNNISYIDLSGSLEPKESNRIPTINEDTANMST